MPTNPRTIVKMTRIWLYHRGLGEVEKSFDKAEIRPILSTTSVAGREFGAWNGRVGNRGRESE